MALSNFWLRHTAMAFLKTLLEELVTEGYLDLVTLDPLSLETASTKDQVWIRGGPDLEVPFLGIPGTDFKISSLIYIRCWAKPRQDEGVSQSIEALVARVRDKILEGMSRTNSFKAQDPPIQVHDASLVEDPAFDSQRDYGAATIGLEIAAHT
jgi:hypothetical protein